MGMSRSDNMRRIRSKNTKPELFIRRLVWALGFKGYRIHRKDLPGKPDIAWIRRKAAIFVHGCFWHGHNCSEGIRKPKSNLDYWIPKIERNRQRDVGNIETLEANGWRVLEVWECEIKDNASLAETLIRFLS
jgi:DNA mismatch endonuclease (patch repair protein)